VWDCRQQCSHAIACEGAEPQVTADRAASHADGAGAPLGADVDPICDIAYELWRAARAKLGPRYNFFSKLAAITTYLIFPT
jgi:hypothetical protein